MRICQDRPMAEFRDRPPRRDAARTVLLLVAGAALCCRTAAPGGAPSVVQPGAPGEPSRVVPASQVTDVPRARHTDADVRFMQRMIGHHAQALEMTALVPSRTDNESVRKLALRIEVSQADEIRMMEEWLTDRGAPLPDRHAHHAPGAALMPGMLTADEMHRLSAAKGRAFDRLFLELMIKHHEGALVMVAELFETPGAAQESEISAFASEVEADQRIEIQRMAAMLKEMEA